MTGRWVLAFALVAGCGGGGGGAIDAAVIDTALPPIDAMIDAGPPVGAPPNGACQHGWCWVYPRPQGSPLRAIWGTSTTDVWTVGLLGAALHYDGVSWTEHPTTNDLDFVWGTAANDVWAAGRDQVLHWNGAAWSSSTTVGDAGALGGTGPGDVWVYDATAKDVVQWNGAIWTPHALPAAGWQPLAFGGPAGTTLCVSRTGGIAIWQGNAWGIADSGGHPANAAAIVDASHVIVAQNGGAIARWNGAGWTTTTAPVAASWTTIAAASFDDVWLAGNLAGLPVRYHWSGGTWSAADDAGDTGMPAGLWLDPGGHPWAAMDDAEVAVWNGAAWTRTTVGDNYVTSVGGTADDDLWIVSQVPASVARNRITRWNGVEWTEVAFPYDASYTLGRIWVSRPDDVWIAAGHRVSDSQIDRVMIHRAGVTWTVTDPLGTEDGILSPEGFTGVWGAGPDDVYAVARTAVYHFDGGGWTKIAALPGGTDVLGTAASDVYVLDGADVWSWNGAAWTKKTAPTEVARGWTTTALHDIWLQGPPSPASGIHYDGATFSVYQPIAGQGVPVGAATDMFTFHYDLGFHMTEWVGGFAGTKTVTPAFFVPIGNGWRAPSGRVYAAGGPGLLVH